jgi:hypothetical protein
LNWKKLKTLIPNKVHVGPKVYYNVFFVNGLQDNGFYGQTDYDKREILLDMKMSPKLTVTTYLHEYFHALSAEHQINLTESQCQALEKTIPYLLKNNNLFPEKV